MPSISKLKLIFWSIFWLGLFWHLHAIWHQQLFGDEIHSLFFFQEHSWASLLLKPVEPIHPNGFYLLIKLLYSITPSVLALRIWMWLVFAASCLVLRKTLQKVGFSPLMVVGSLAIWSSSAYLWHFTFQLRMYGPAILLILLSLLSLVNRRPWLSAIFDWLALFFAYGSIIFILAKWLSYILLNKPKNLTQILPSVAVFFPISYILFQFFINHNSIDTSYLYWVHPVVWPDLSLGIFSYLTGLFLPYFEGFSALGKKWLMLGSGLNLVWLIALMTASSWAGVNRELILKKWRGIPRKQLFIIHTSLLSLLIYLILFIWSLVTHGHLFHIRQTFSVALATWLLVFWLLEKIYQKLPWLVLLTIVSVTGINQLSIAKDSLGAGQAYLHHFQTLPDSLVIASPSDVELIYKQCHTFDRKRAEQICQQRNIYLTTPTLPVISEGQKIWLTNTAKNGFKNTANCQQVMTDFWECKTNFKQ